MLSYVIVHCVGSNTSLTALLEDGPPLLDAGAQPLDLLLMI